MIQKIILYQAVRYEHKTRTKPIYATDKTWLGEGYYFWEHEIANAHHWGKVHYSNRYCIYQSSYQNTEEGLDLVDNHEHLDMLEKYIRQIKERIQKSVDLAQIIILICKHVPKSVHYIRIDTGSFFPNERFLLPVPNKQFSPQLYAKRLVQVCFPSFPCPEIGLTDYQLYEETTPVIG